MSVSDVKSRVLSGHDSNPQRRGLAEIHLDELERAIAGLAALGDNVTLDMGGAPPAIQYPKMLYHAKEINHKIVESSDEEKEARKLGWNEWPGGVPPNQAVRMPGASVPAATVPPTTKVSVPSKGG